jgi:hypothetical protein
MKSIITTVQSKWPRSKGIILKVRTEVLGDRELQLVQQLLLNYEER